MSSNRLDAYKVWPHCESVDLPLSVGGLPYLTDVVHGLIGQPAWNLNPTYQRAACWTDIQARRFMGHFLAAGPVPAIFVQRYRDSKNAPTGVNWLDLSNEVVDGQQRLRAMLRWLADEIPAEMDNGDLLWYRDLNKTERRTLPSVHVSFVDMPIKERLRFYIRLNRGGTVHTEEEIQRVRDLLAEQE